MYLSFPNSPRSMSSLCVGNVGRLYVVWCMCGLNCCYVFLSLGRYFCKLFEWTWEKYEEPSMPPFGVEEHNSIICNASRIYVQKWSATWHVEGYLRSHFRTTPPLPNVGKFSGAASWFPSIPLKDCLLLLLVVTCCISGITILTAGVPMRSRYAISLKHTLLNIRNKNLGLVEYWVWKVNVIYVSFTTC